MTPISKEFIISLITQLICIPLHLQAQPINTLTKQLYFEKVVNGRFIFGEQYCLSLNSI